MYFGIDINCINYLLFGDALVCRPISHNKNSPKYPVWNFYRLFYFHMRQCKGHCVNFLNVYDLKLCEGKISMSVFVWRIISKKLLFTYSFCKNLPNVSASHHRHGDLLTWAKFFLNGMFITDSSTIYIMWWISPKHSGAPLPWITILWSIDSWKPIISVIRRTFFRIFYLFFGGFFRKF